MNDEGCELWEAVTPSALSSNVSASSANGVKGVDSELLARFGGLAMMRLNVPLV